MSRLFPLPLLPVSPVFAGETVFRQILIDAFFRDSIGSLKERNNSTLSNRVHNVGGALTRWQAKLAEFIPMSLEDFQAAPVRSRCLESDGSGFLDGGYDGIREERVKVVKFA